MTRYGTDNPRELTHKEIALIVATKSPVEAVKIHRQLTGSTLRVALDAITIIRATAVNGRNIDGWLFRDPDGRPYGVSFIADIDAAWIGQLSDRGSRDDLLAAGWTCEPSMVVCQR